MSAAKPLVTRVGRADWGENQFLGHAVRGELARDETLTGALVLAITGRRASREQRDVIDDITVSMLVADPRIWPLKMVRVVSAHGGAMAAFGAALLAAEGAVVGPSATKAAAELLCELGAAVSGTPDTALESAFDAQLARTGRLAGFGVPFRDRDERVLVLRERLIRRGAAELPHWRLFEQVTSLARLRHRLESNVVLAMAAACLDAGFAPAEVAQITMLAFQPAYLANALEGARQAPEILRRLPADSIRYAGRAPRSGPWLARQTGIPSPVGGPRATTTTTT
jgi:hypothetical protein